MDVLTCVAIGATCLTTIVCSSLAFARRVIEREDEPTEEELAAEVERLSRRADAMVKERSPNEWQTMEEDWKAARLRLAKLRRSRL